MWVTRPDQKQSHWPTRFHAARWRRFFVVFLPLALVYQAQAAMFLIASITVSMAAAAWMGRWFARRLQGFTGDCLGATQQVGEIGFTWVPPWRWARRGELGCVVAGAARGTAGGTRHLLRRAGCACRPQATQQTARRLAEALPTGTLMSHSPLQRCEQLAHYLIALRPDLA